MRMVPALTLMRILMSLENGGVLAGRVITRPKLKARLGDSVLLECFFQSLVPGDWNVTKVDWIHMPENSTQVEEMVFYYYSNHSVPVGRFRPRVQWLGDVARKNGSVRLQDVQADDSGTYTCEIRVFGRSSVFKNYTVLHVASAGRRGSGFAGAQYSESTGSSGWRAILGYVCATTFLALLLGLGLKKFLQKQRPMESGPLSRSRDDGSRDKGEEGIYSLILCAEMLQAGQEAELGSRTDTTYITMVSFVSGGPSSWGRRGDQGLLKTQGLPCTGMTPLISTPGHSVGSLPPGQLWGSSPFGDDGGLGM
uniref:Junction adhesion molecule like n=1 Tax=Chrysemys picta bellii TaxID=8478 RepID=A0A8C3I7E1_CHRPI